MAQATTKTYDADAEMFQNLSGAAAAENPYLPFLEPKVIDRGDGKRVLRIPKNQQLLDLGKFFDTAGNTKFKNANDFAKTYLDFLKSNREEKSLQLDTAKTMYDINKPYFKPTAPKVTKVDKVGKFKMEKNASGGLRFTQEQKDGTLKPITAAEYALLSGQDVLDVLANDPTSNSQKVIDDTKAIETKIQNGDITAQAGLDALIKAYPNVYGSSR
jgi:hypothetical protein